MNKLRSFIFILLNLIWVADIVFFFAVGLNKNYRGYLLFFGIFWFMFLIFSVKSRFLCRCLCNEDEEDDEPVSQV